ncbi:MAG: nucleotidyltransferase domain-containing protein [Elusimicrobia bacterium]|nr:nucleotidyltransferase domain-containing protein [Elusimicrobiota bacterium]
MRSVSHLRYPLDRIFSISSHTPILRAIQDCREGMSSRAIAREARVNHQSCAVAVKNLEALGLLQRQGSGKTQLIRLNFKNYIVKNLLLPLLRQEREFLKKLKQEITETFKKDALAITLFGSAARDQDILGSDIDLLLIIQGPNKNKILTHAMTYSSTFVHRYGIRLSSIVMTVRQVKDRVKRSDPLMKNILSEGIDLLPQRLKNLLS